MEEKYEVTAVPNGKEALEYAEQNNPELIITDIMMPVMNGIELTKRLRSRPATNTIPIIMLSAQAGEEAKVEGLKVGASDYLVKPFSATELLARVQLQINVNDDFQLR